MPGISDENAPTEGPIMVGIELEGVGNIRTDWSAEGVIHSVHFHDVFKRMKLVRSKSFDANRGVYLAPEDVEGTFGTQGPAELVSSPHIFDVTNLNHLRNSVRTALSKGMVDGATTASFVDPLKASHPFQNAEARSTWGRAWRGHIGGSLQTTIGVNVEQLLSDDPKVRERVVNLLVGNPVKQGYAQDLLAAAVAGGDFLIDSGLLPTYAGKKYGIRLALFMYLAYELCGAMCERGWGKTALGANFKGYSSFVGCGVAVNNSILSSQMTTPDIAASTKAALINAMMPRTRKAVGSKTVDVQKQIVDSARSTTKERVYKNVIVKEKQLVYDMVAHDNWITTALQASRGFDLAKIGQPGWAYQTSIEQWFAIPCFTKNGHLHTVVESREKDSGLNIRMAMFLNGSQDSDTSALYGQVGTIIGA